MPSAIQSAKRKGHFRLGRRKFEPGGEKDEKTMIMRRFGFLGMAAALTAAGISGCATKNYVRTQTAPVIQHAGQLDNATAENHRQIQDVDQRAQSGIHQAQGAADTANQNAQNASQEANTAQTAANDAVTRADTLDSVVKGLDNYKQLANVSVTFGFNKSTLTADDRQQLDGFAAQLASNHNYILEVTGGTDSTGPAQYNYDLSQRRADAVVQYLAAKYNVPARRFYLIGIGKDEYVAPNTTAAGRKENRRVQVQMLTNMPTESAQSNGMQQQAPASSTQPQEQPDNPPAQPSGTTQNATPPPNSGPQQ
jgi:OmpA-OmpF porin, OOP family